jgi:stress response protein YsnF
MEQAEPPFAIGVFRERALAKQAIDELHHAGFRDDQVWLPGSGTSGGGFLDGLVSRMMGDEHQRSLNALAGHGLSQSEIEYYQHELEAGHTVVVVQSYGRQREARDILNRFGAYDASTHSPLTDVHRIQLREEVLLPQKELVETGEVFIRKVVVTEEKTITIPIRREEIVIERRSVSPTSAERQVSQADQPASQPVQQGEGRLVEVAENETIRIPLRIEQVFIEKRPVVAEELIVSKHNIQEIRRYSDTVQREEARLEREGDVTIHGDRVEEAAPQDRNDSG